MTSLAKELDIFFRALLERVDAPTAALLRRPVTLATTANVRTAPLGLGEIAPDFTLPDQNGAMVSLQALRSTGPVVVVFFRGGWCPFCTITLRAMERVRAQIKRAGGSLVAISPQTLVETDRTAERNGLRFPVLADAGNAVAKRYGLVWALEPERQALYQRLGHDLPRINGDASWELPLGAGYVIAPDGAVVQANIGTDIHTRLEPADALAAVRAVAGQTVAG